MGDRWSMVTASGRKVFVEGTPWPADAACETIRVDGVDVSLEPSEWHVLCAAVELDRFHRGDSRHLVEWKRRGVQIVERTAGVEPGGLLQSAMGLSVHDAPGLLTAAQILARIGASAGGGT